METNTKNRYLVGWKCNKGSVEQVREVLAESAVQAVALVLSDAKGIDTKRESQDGLEFLMKVRGYHSCTVSKF